jgi:hypothetical protein
VAVKEETPQEKKKGKEKKVKPEPQEGSWDQSQMLQVEPLEKKNGDTPLGCSSAMWQTDST